MSPRYSQQVSRTSNLYPSTCIRRYVYPDTSCSSGYMYPGYMCPGVNAALDMRSMTELQLLEDEVH